MREDRVQGQTSKIGSRATPLIGPEASQMYSTGRTLVKGGMRKGMRRFARVSGGLEAAP